MPSQLNHTLVTKHQYRDLPNFSPPSEAQLHHPVKVVQFGSGALLRGFIDFFIDQANRQGVFEGKAVIVNNTRSGRSTLFNEQQGLFTLCVEGYADGETKKEYIINAAVEKALPAVDHWPEILSYAADPAISIVTSNTTEVGIVLQEDDDLEGTPPQSFPGKLTAFLYERFQKLGGTSESGLVILPTELILDNGAKLQDIVLQLSDINHLGDDFATWVKESNLFCNTLVDRIVPGEPDEEKQQRLEEELGYQDGLLTVSEIYRFFAIEGDEATLHRKVPFLKTDPGIVVREDITPYRERKLRILNGGHTISVAAGFLCGLETVYDCMEDEVMLAFITQVIQEEIVPSLDIDEQMAQGFADDVLDRFRNPFLHHQLISITLQYTSKMNMRNGLTFTRYYNKFGKVPERMCAGFAAYLLFTRPTHQEGGQYYGTFQNQPYPIKDSEADFFLKLWKKVDERDAATVENLVDQVLTHTSWDQPLPELEGFSQCVKQYLTRYLQQGVKSTLAPLVKK